MALETLSFLFESTKVNSSAAIVHFFEFVSEKTGKEKNISIKAYNSKKNQMQFKYAKEVEE